MTIGPAWTPGKGANPNCPLIRSSRISCIKYEIAKIPILIGMGLGQISKQTKNKSFYHENRLNLWTKHNSAK